MSCSPVHCLLTRLTRAFSVIHLLHYSINYKNHPHSHFQQMYIPHRLRTSALLEDLKNLQRLTLNLQQARALFMILLHIALPKYNHPSGCTYYNLSHLRTRLNTLKWPEVRRWLHRVSQDCQKGISHLNFISLDWLPIDQVQQKANAGSLKAFQ